MKKKLFSILGALLLFGGLVYAAGSVYEIESILLLRSTNPQIRWNGTATITKSANDALYAPIGYGRPVIVTNAATRTLTYAECGAVVIANGVATPGTQSFTLPAAASSGCMFTFINGIADGTQEIRVLGADAAACVVTDTIQVGADVDTGILTQAVCTTGFKNTAATNAVDNSMTIISDGTRWLGIGLTTGVWATL